MEAISHLRPNTLPIILPSGRTVTIREQNGDDDEILSKLVDASDGSNIANFLSAIIVQPRLTPEDFLKWPVNDRYLVLLESRIFSLGETLNFDHTCQNTKCGKSTPFTEDLKNFRVGAKDGPKPYPKDMGEWVNLTLSSKKEIRYKYLDGAGEKIILAASENAINKNLELTARSFQFKDETNKWITVERFNIFNAREMAEIRKSYMAQDPPYQGISLLRCQHCGNVSTINIYAQVDFFYPLGV